MQSVLKCSQNNFLKKYYPVLVHHVNCILESRLLLDEDLHLLLTFWSPTAAPHNVSYVYSTVACATSAVFGVIIASKTNNLYPFIASLTPVVLHFSYKSRVMYCTRRYKRNCEKLVAYLRELYELNRNVLQYLQRASFNLPKVSENGFGLLQTTRCDFVKFVLATLMNVLYAMVSKIREVSKIVPIIEGEYMYAAKWDLEHFVPNDKSDLKELMHKYENLSDLSVLIVSNFLGCIGLTFCLQLWQENAVNFNKIFDDVIPDTCKVLQSSIQSINDRFNCTRYTLIDSTDEYKKRRRKEKVSVYGQLQLPLDDFLLNTQVLFEVGKHLQELLDQDRVNKDKVMLSVNEVDHQFSKCSDLLDTLVKSVRVVTRNSQVSDTHLNVDQDVPVFLVPVDVHREDDSSPLLEDEEYSLSIHGSDPGDEIIAPIIDFADQCSSENLELMLVELKRKLDERKKKKDSDSAVKVECVIDKAPPVPPAIPCLPTVDNSQRNFLDAIRAVAQNLNREEEFQFGFNMFPEIPRPFNTTYHCYSVAMLPGNERQDVERGGKIIMPPSALEQLTRLNINYPMLFKIVNKKTNRTSHCGVLEFVADEGKVYLPLWMMHNLVLEESDLIQIESVSLPVGKFAKFQPLSPEFLDITNPKAVLENCLRTFACLTTGDVIAVKYNQKAYELCVLETQPGNAISIIECDMNVEFAAPIGYKEAEDSKQNEEEMTVDVADLMPEPTGFVAFKGTGNRLDGKRRKDSASTDLPVQKPVYVRGIPDYEYQIGTLRFLRNIVKSPAVDKEDNPEFKVFGGKGFSLKHGV